MAAVKPPHVPHLVTPVETRNDIPGQAAYRSHPAKDHPTIRPVVDCQTPSAQRVRLDHVIAASTKHPVFSCKRSGEVVGIGHPARANAAMGDSDARVTLLRRVHYPAGIVFTPVIDQYELLKDGELIQNSVKLRTQLRYLVSARQDNGDRREDFH